MNNVNDLAVMSKVFGVQLLGAAVFLVSTDSGRGDLKLMFPTVGVLFFITIYTIWAMKRGLGFDHYGRLWLSGLKGLLGFALIQMMFPLRKIGMMIYGAVGLSLLPLGIVYATSQLIKHHRKLDHVLALARTSSLGC